MSAASTLRISNVTSPPEAFVEDNLARRTEEANDATSEASYFFKSNAMEAGTNSRELRSSNDDDPPPLPIVRIAKG